MLEQKLNNIREQKLNNKKAKKDQTFKIALIILTSFVTVFIISIIALIFVKGFLGFFHFDELTFKDFLFGGYYNPTSSAFAAGFMIINTLWISFLALLIALPISVFTALFVTKVVPKQFKSIFYVVISILAAIPTVIYGAFGLSIIDFIVVNLFGVYSGTSLSVIITLAFMIMPTITILSISSIDSVDSKMQQSSIALGATEMQTSFRVTLRAASKGILVASLLGLGRALGEATAVSMVASQSAYGPNFNPFGFTTLITATMLQGWPEVASGSVEQASMLAMASLLMITILIVFIAMRFLEKQLDLEHKSLKATKKIKDFEKMKQKIDHEGFLNLNSQESQLYINDYFNKNNFDLKKEETNILRDISLINLETSFEKNTYIKIQKYKSKRELRAKILTYIFAFFGVFLLLSIISFLFLGGFEVLNFDYISSKGIYSFYEQNGITQNIYGLVTPLFGTLFTVLIALLIALPVGVLITILLSIYFKRNSKTSNFIEFIVQLLTGIPSLIYGIIGSIIFVPLFTNQIIQFNSLSAAFTISLFILPTIIKTTQNGLNSIPPSQKDAALGLGATNYIASKTLIKQVIPSIVSAAVLSAGLIMADSAIFITIYGTFSQSDSISWLTNGGTTLSSEIYKLTKQEVILWDYVKAIGIVIIFLIILISTLANFISNKKNKQAIMLASGILLLFVSIFTATYWLYIISLVYILIAIIFVEFYKMLNKKYNFNIKIKRRYLEYRGRK